MKAWFIVMGGCSCIVDVCTQTLSAMRFQAPEPEHVHVCRTSEECDVPGLHLIPDFITEAQEEARHLKHFMLWEELPRTAASCRRAPMCIARRSCCKRWRPDPGSRWRGDA